MGRCSMISKYLKGFGNRSLAVLFWLAVTCSVHSKEAPSRIWTLKDGRSVEASYIVIIGDSVMLKTSKERQIKIPVVQLCDEDRLFLELSRPPALEIDFIRNLNTVTFSEGYYGSFPREPEQHGNFGLRIKQTSTGSYLHPLKAEMYVVGQQIGVSDKKCFLLDRQEFPFSFPESGKKEVQFMSERSVRLENWHFEYKDSRAVDHGELYYGYLIVVYDTRNEVVAVQTSKVWLEKSLENLKKINVGNFFGKDCVRCFPGRPKPLRW